MATIWRLVSLVLLATMSVLGELCVDTDECRERIASQDQCGRSEEERFIAVNCRKLCGLCRFSRLDGGEGGTVPVVPTYRCTDTSAEIAFILDASSSVGEENFGKVRRFTQQVTRRLKAEYQQLNVTVITFSNKAQILLQLNESVDVDAMVAAESNITYTHGGTQTHKALNLAYQAFHHDVNSTKIAIVITDGASFEPDLTRQAAANAKNHGVTIFVVAVGDDVNPHETKDVSSDPDDRYMRMLQSFNDLQSLVGFFHIRNCTVTTTSTTSTTTTTTEAPVTQPVTTVTEAPVTEPQTAQTFTVTNIRVTQEPVTQPGQTPTGKPQTAKPGQSPTAKPPYIPPSTTKFAIKTPGAVSGQSPSAAPVTQTGATPSLVPPSVSTAKTERPTLQTGQTVQVVETTRQTTTTTAPPTKPSTVRSTTTTTEAATRPSTKATTTTTFAPTKTAAKSTTTTTEATTTPKATTTTTKATTTTTEATTVPTTRPTTTTAPPTTPTSKPTTTTEVVTQKVTQPPPTTTKPTTTTTTAPTPRPTSPTTTATTVPTTQSTAATTTTQVVTQKVTQQTTTTTAATTKPSTQPTTKSVVTTQPTTKPTTTTTEATTQKHTQPTTTTTVATTKPTTTTEATTQSPTKPPTTTTQAPVTTKPTTLPSTTTTKERITQKPEQTTTTKAITQPTTRATTKSQPPATLKPTTVATTTTEAATPAATHAPTTTTTTEKMLMTTTTENPVTTTTKPPTTTTASCIAKIADVVFVVDTSGSIGLANFEKVKAFIREVIMTFDVDSRYTRVGLIEYSTYAHIEFKLHEKTNLTDLLDAVDNVTYSGGGTATAEALQLMRTDGFDSVLKVDNVTCAGRGTATAEALHLMRTDGFDRERPAAPDIAIVITDGLSKFPALTRAQANLAKKDGITMFSIGIGNETASSELVAIASDRRYVFEVGDYETLLTLDNVVAHRTCGVELPEEYHSRSTAPVPTTQTGCYDLDANCADYPRDSCTDYAPYAKKNCARKCGYCPGQVIVEPPCEDVEPNCASYGTDMCYKSSQYEWVDKHCRKFCSFCGNKTEIPLSTTTVPTTLAVTTAAACFDLDAKCDKYGGPSMCHQPSYEAWARHNCKKYCGYCYTYHTVTSATVNNVNCPKWTLPEQCSLVYSAGQCCPYPSCPDGFTLTVKRKLKLS